MHDIHLLKMLIFGAVEGDLQPGRPARKWIDDILKWSKMSDIDAGDKTEWRKFLISPNDLALIIGQEEKNATARGISQKAFVLTEASILMIYSKLIVDVNVSAWQYFTVALALALAPFLVLPCLLTMLSVSWL